MPYDGLHACAQAGGSALRQACACRYDKQTILTEGVDTRLQEEIEQKVVTLIIDCTRLSERVLQRALREVLQIMKEGQAASRQKGKERTKTEHHGRMTVKELAEQNKGMQNVEVTSQDLGSFSRVARKYGIDFAPFRVKGQKRYLIFFKAQDAAAMTAAFREYTQQSEKKLQRPSVLKRLEQLRERVEVLSAGRSRDKERER